MLRSLFCPSLCFLCSSISALCINLPASQPASLWLPFIYKVFCRPSLFCSQSRARNRSQSRNRSRNGIGIGREVAESKDGLANGKYLWWQNLPLSILGDNFSHNKNYFSRRDNNSRAPSGFIGPGYWNPLHPFPSRFSCRLLVACQCR